jgi:hypothetical protein
VSKSSKSDATYYRIHRKEGMRLAFEEGMRLLDDPNRRQAIIDGTEPNWKGMAVLTNGEKGKVRHDVREFALANSIVAKEELEKARNPRPKKGFVEKAREFFGL